jgi:hypothetical protein
MRSIDVIIRELCLAINDGKQLRGVAKESAGDNAAPGAESGPRRSRRSQFRADDSSAGGAPSENERAADAVPARQA